MEISLLEGLGQQSQAWVSKWSASRPCGMAPLGERERVMLADGGEAQLAHEALSTGRHSPLSHVGPRRSTAVFLL